MVAQLKPFQPTKELPFPWQAGQHLALIGMTGSGKSTLANRLLSSRRFAIVLRSKADKIKYDKTSTASRATAMDDQRVSRLVLSPPYQRQSSEFASALERVWRQGGWTVYIDELHYVDGELRLRDPINRLLTQGRDPGRISVVCGMQRPTTVTRFAIGEATHVVCFNLEGRDVKILRDATRPALADVVTELGHHEFAWLHVPTKRIWVGKLDPGSKQNFIGETI